MGPVAERTARSFLTKRPALAVVFFNSDRQVVHRRGSGRGPAPSLGAAAAAHSKCRSTRLASVEIRLWGGTGEVSVAQVALTVIAAKPHAGVGQPH